jgi:hypothetical protein
MKNDYTTVKLKRSTVNSLKRAAALINMKEPYAKATVAGLINGLAESYDTQMDDKTLSGNAEKWILDGVPVILNSDAAKHFRELKDYEPINCSTMISQHIRNEAMRRRFEKVGISHED